MFMKKPRHMAHLTEDVSLKSVVWKINSLLSSFFSDYRRRRTMDPLKK
jgi:hypothetical protein